VTLNKRFLFQGLVQHVHFRMSVIEYATKHHCEAIATNQDDGTVYVNISGEFHNIEATIHSIIGSFKRSNASIVVVREL